MHFGAPPHLRFMHSGAPPHLRFMHSGAPPHLRFMHSGAPPHLRFMHSGAPPHLRFMHSGAPPPLRFMHSGAPPHLRFMHSGAPPHLRFMHSGAPPHLRFMHYGAPPHFLLAVWQCLNTLFLEQWIAWGGPTTWPARSRDLNPLYFLSLVTSAVYCLCYKILRHPTLGTANSEGISANSRDTWNFQSSQALTVQMCNVLRLSSRWTLTVFVNRQEAATQKPLFSRPTLRKLDPWWWDRQFVPKLR